MIDAVFEPTLTTYLIILPAIYLAGLTDAVAGGGGLLSVPAYMAAGLPTHMVLGNNKFSSAFGTAFTTLRYLHGKMIDLPVAGFAALTALLGSWLGTSTVLAIDPFFLRLLLIVLIPLMLAFVLLRSGLGKVNDSHKMPLRLRIPAAMGAGLVIGFWDGFFGPGTGAFLILFFTSLLHYDFVTANANTKVLNLSSNVASLVTFLVHGQVIFALAIPAAVAGILGNMTGSHLVIRKGNGLIRPVFIAVLTLLFLKIVWDMLRAGSI